MDCSAHHLEWRRQAMHLLYGFLLIGLHRNGLLPLPLLFGVIAGGSVVSWMVKRQRLDWATRLLLLFERQKHMEQFPARGFLFFTIGAFLVLLLFPEPMAYAGIAILSVGDAVTNLVGRHFGRLKTAVNPKKSLEGTVVGILFSIPAAYPFVPDWKAVSAAAIVALFLELPEIRIAGMEIDDNLVIPLAAAVTLNIFM